MANSPTEAPAAYVLAARFYETVQEMLAIMNGRHEHISLELLKYSERIVGNVGAAEAPFAADRRQVHYQIAFGAICGSASACDLIHRFDFVPKPLAERALQVLSSLAGMVRPIGEEGLPPRPEDEEAILNEILKPVEDDTDHEDWEDRDEFGSW